MISPNIRSSHGKIEIVEKLAKEMDSQSQPQFLLKRKRKGEDVGDLGKICNRLSKDSVKEAESSKITDFFKIKKKITGNMVSVSSNIRNDNKEIDRHEDFINEEELSESSSKSLDSQNAKKKEKNDSSNNNSNYSNSILKNSPTQILKLSSRRQHKKSPKNSPSQSIKDYLKNKDLKKEFKLSLKTLNILKKGNFIKDIIITTEKNSNHSKSQMNKHIGNIHALTRNNNRENSLVIKEVEKILNDLSMKEKYEGLLRRELVLPPAYKTLLLQFIFLDTTLIHIKFGTEINTHNRLDTLLSIIEKIAVDNNFKQKFTLEDFQKILYIGPILFLYKYILPTSRSTSNINNKFDIKIDIPADFETRLTTDYSNTVTNTFQFHQLQSLDTNRPIEIYPTPESMQKRQTFFKDILIKLTISQHDKFLKKRKIKHFDPVKAGTWHSEFNFEQVNKIKLFNLFPAPRREKKFGQSRGRV